MKFQYQRLTWIIVMAFLVLFLSASVSYAETPAAEYEVTITNLTSNQPLTPPVIATHRNPVEFFKVGRPARREIQQVAENGNLDPIVETLSNRRDVSEVVVAAGNPPPLLPSTSVTVSISGDQGAKFFTFASMLICTNDGFTGVASLGLPEDVGDSVSVQTDGYDAGTEINTEDFADIVPPCQALSGVSSEDEGTGMSNHALAEGGVIHHHQGIDGTLPTSDLTVEDHGWDTSAPVAEILITRTN
jgi:hypothetical protein